MGMFTMFDGKKLIYIGTGAGLILYVLLGFFPSAMVGGFVGLKLVEIVMGVENTGILAQVIAVVSMIGAVIFTAVAFVLGGALAGYIIAQKFCSGVEAKVKV